MLRRFFVLITLSLCIYNSFADVRQDIDTQRAGVGYFDKKSLDLSRDFIKMDSNYYVGWMYLAAAKFDKSQDRFGYTLAIASFEKAMQKFEKDYKNQLRVNSSDLMAFIQAYPRQIDYTFMAYYLYTSYMGTEQMDKAYALCKKVLRFNMMNPFYFEAYNHMTWITHRVRTQTSKQYYFLKDNVLDNERLALKYCDSSNMLINKNYSSNASLFGDASTSEQYNSNHFYKSVIYSYLCIPDSAEMFFDKIKDNRIFSHNNYAYLKLVTGDFKEAEKEFLIEKENEDPSDKKTKEFTYMLSVLNIYKGNPYKDVDSLPNYIQNRGEIPGFGWDNLALARSSYYAGDHPKSNKYLAKAESFQELHLNTSWSPEQYNYSISLLKYLNSERDIQLAKFNNRNWWCNIPTLMELPKLYIKKISNGHQFTADFALNKERELAFYQVFNSECLITFDEIWKTIEGYNTDFFIKKYEQYLKMENRVGVRRYYNYFLAKLHYKKENYEQALKYMAATISDDKFQFGQEKLLEARLLELKALILKKQGKDKESQELRNQFYETYPSLLLFSDLDKQFKIKIIQGGTALDSVINDLKNANIEIVDANNTDIVCPTIELTEESTAKGKMIRYEVKSSGGIIAKGQLMAKKEQAGTVLAYNIFDVRIDEIETYGKNNYWLIGSIFAIAGLLWYVYTLKMRRSML